MAEKCKFIKNDGKHCKAYKMAGADFCFFHDPEFAEDRAAARSRGGKLTANRNRSEALIGEVIEFAEEIELKEGNGKPALKFKTLEDLQAWGEQQIKYIEENKRYAVLSQTDRALLIRWFDALLKLQIVKGLGAADRIAALEDIAQKQQPLLKR